MTSRDPERCCEAVRLAILATAWLLVFCKSVQLFNLQLSSRSVLLAVVTIACFHPAAVHLEKCSIKLMPLAEEGVPRRQSYRRSGLTNLPSVGAVP